VSFAREEIRGRESRNASAPTQMSGARSLVSGSVANVPAVSIQSDVRFGMHGKLQKKHRTAGQGGPKTLPAALWQAVCGVVVAPAERLSGGPDRLRRPDTTEQSNVNASAKVARIVQKCSTVALWRISRE
jgi:hypothetical protein